MANDPRRKQHLPVQTERATAVLDEPTPETDQESQPETVQALVVPEVVAMGFPPPGSLPATFPPLGHTPTRIQEILVNAGAKATHFSGPIVSGFPTANHMSQQAAGTAILACALRIDYSMGSFSLPIQFPHDAILLWAVSVGLTAFSGGAAPTLALGSAASGADILAATTVGAAGTAITPVTGILPPASATHPFQAYLTLTNAGSTAGSAIILLLFARTTSLWF